MFDGKKVKPLLLPGFCEDRSLPLPKNRSSAIHPAHLQRLRMGSGLVVPRRIAVSLMNASLRSVDRLRHLFLPARSVPLQFSSLAAQPRSSMLWRPHQAAPSAQAIALLAGSSATSKPNCAAAVLPDAIRQRRSVRTATLRPPSHCRTLDKQFPEQDLQRELSAPPWQFPIRAIEHEHCVLES